MATPAGPTNPAITEHHVKFLQSRGVKVANVSDVTKYVAKLSDADRATFFVDAAAWKEPATVIPATPEFLKAVEIVKARGGYSDAEAEEVVNDKGAASIIADDELKHPERKEAEKAGARQFTVLRNLEHNSKLYKAGSKMGEELFTPEQIDSLVEIKTIAEVTPESEEQAEEEQADTAATAGVRAIALLFPLDGKQMEDLREHITDQLMEYAHAAAAPVKVQAPEVKK
ncbi:MAG: hypothetical protein WBA09_22320 [Candidatus Acidiferrum sp.]